MADVPISLVAWTHNYAFTQQSVKIALDNFILVSGTPVCPAKGISVQSFFTDSQLAPLPDDSRHFIKADALFAGSKFRQTMPPRVLAWINVTNVGHDTLDSLSITEVLPTSWLPSPDSTTSSKTFLESINGSRIQLSNGPHLTITQLNSTISLTIDDMTQTKAGDGLDPGRSLLLAVPMAYFPTGPNQSSSFYPLTVTSTSIGSGWTGASFTGTQFAGNSTASLTIYAQIQGDLADNGRVDIVDTGMMLYSFGSKIGDSRWIPSADFDGDGVISLIDLSIVFQNYGLVS